MSACKDLTGHTGSLEVKMLGESPFEDKHFLLSFCYFPLKLLPSEQSELESPAGAEGSEALKAHLTAITL